jgi:DNA polymerase-3 subunit alpha
LGSGMVDDFVEIKHGRKECLYPFPQLIPVLKDTYGIIVYQEQVMNIARIVAGYSLGQADILRKAMGKKQIDVMEEHREIFRQGAKDRGFDDQKAVELFDLMAKFAEYGFNKSHAVAYALIAYQTAFLKCYYPAQFFAALLSSELSNMDKITNYIKDAKKCSLSILPPDVNESLWSFNVVKGNIRFGLGAIKNVGENAVIETIRERKANGNYKDFIDYCERVDLKTVNKKVLESFIKVGVFDGQGEYNRKTLLENIELIQQYAQKIQEEKRLGQGSLFQFAEMQVGFFQAGPQLQKEEDFDDKQKLHYEAELMGIYLSGHPLDQYEDIMKEMSSMSLASVHETIGNDKREMILVGMISQKKILLTKKGDKMAFVTLEDFTGKIECILFPRVFQEYESFLSEEGPVVMVGEVNLTEDPKKFFPKKISRIHDRLEETVICVRLDLKVQEVQEHQLQRLKYTLQHYRGPTPVQLIFHHQEIGRGRMPLGEEYNVMASAQLAHKINEVFGHNCVKFLMKEEREERVSPY